MPFFSIITVSFNAEKTIAETIGSVLNQSESDFEYIIIDGASSDSTLEIVESYRSAFKDKGISLRVVSEKDNGIFDAMNKGIKLAEGKIVGIINSDDYYSEETFEKVKAEFEREEFDILYGHLRVFGEKRDFIKRAKEQSKKFSTLYWNHPTMFVAKTVYNEYMYAVESMYDDLDFILRSRERNKKIVVLDEILANFRLGGVSNGKSWKGRGDSIKLRNHIYSKYNQKGYRFNNWFMETVKYFLSK
ncbi:MAG: glycosyltransferase [Firmicutes bacterium]|nr:glycosyltransferase [Bacillota bacterium]